MAGRNLFDDMKAARPKGRNLFAKEGAPAQEGGVLSRAAKNAPSSAANFVRSIKDAVTSPVQTGGALTDLFVGGVQNALPEWAQAGSAEGQRNVASAVGQHFSGRYGSLDRAKETFATDPVGFLADATLPLTGGGAALVKAGQFASKAPQLARAGNVVSTAGNVASRVGAAIDPVNVAAKVAAPVAAVTKAGAARAADLVGMFPQTGGEAVRQAFTSGAKGGEAGQTFRANMRGDAPAAEVVQQAKDALATIRRERGSAYRSGMADISKDKTVLDMQPVLDDLNTQSAKGNFKGQDIDPSAAKARQEVTEAVAEWQKLDPAEFHTPEGLDALKQKIGSIADGYEYGTRARSVIDGVYNSVKASITKQAPGYAKVMKEYEEASTALKEIEKALSLGKKGTADTALRKLQSILRNNANTNYGARLESAAKLEGAGATTLRNALAGQAMNSWTPRGIPLTSATAGVMGFISNPLSLIPIAAGSSPRLVGEVAHAAGRIGNQLGRVAPTVNRYGRPAATPTYQAGQARQNALAR